MMDGGQRSYTSCETRWADPVVQLRGRIVYVTVRYRYDLLSTFVFYYEKCSEKVGRVFKPKAGRWVVLPCLICNLIPWTNLIQAGVIWRGPPKSNRIEIKLIKLPDPALSLARSSSASLLVDLAVHSPTETSRPSLPYKPPATSHPPPQCLVSILLLHPSINSFISFQHLQTTSPFSHLSKPPNLTQNDWRQIRRQGQRQQVCSIVSLTPQCAFDLSIVSKSRYFNALVSCLTIASPSRTSTNSLSTAVPQRPVSHSQSVVSTVFSERATTLNVSVLVPQSTSLPSLSTSLPKSSSWPVTPLVTTRRPVSSHVTCNSPSETMRS